MATARSRIATGRCTIPSFSLSEDPPLSHMIEAIPLATKHGQSSKVGLLRYVVGSAVALAVLFSLFLLAGMEL